MTGAKILLDSLYNSSHYNTWEAVCKPFGKNPNVENIRSLSRQYYTTNILYRRMIEFLTNMSLFQYTVMPRGRITKPKPFEKDLDQATAYCDGLDLPFNAREFIRQVLIDGVYYGLAVERDNRTHFIKLDSNYCRSYKVNEWGIPILEINLSIFTSVLDQRNVKIDIRDTDWTAQIDSHFGYFPVEIIEAYKAFRLSNKDEFWFEISTDIGIVLYFGDMTPFLSGLIPALANVKEYEALEKIKDAQEIEKLLVQRIPMNDEDDFTVDPLEAEEITKYGKSVLGKDSHMKIFTSPMEVSVHDVQSTKQAAANNLEKVQDYVFDNSGFSPLLFGENSAGGIKYSTQNAMSIVQGILYVIGRWVNYKVNKNAKKNQTHTFFFDFLPTTVYNYEDYNRLYRENAAIGGSKLAFLVSGGMTQSSVLATIQLENEIYNLPEIVKPFQSAYTQSGSDQGGAPEVAEKAENTLLNDESRE